MKKTVLTEAQQLVYGDRQRAYGHPAKNYEVIAGLMTEYLRGRGFLLEGSNLEASDAAQLMLLMKIGRFSTGDRGRDTLVDEAGYVEVTARTLDVDP